MLLNFNIRNARPEDAAELTALIFASKASNGYDEAFMEACRAELFVAPKDIEDGWFWVAERKGALIGVVSLAMDNDDNTRGEIARFFVHPDEASKGVGRSLWYHMVDAALALGVVNFYLDADPFAVAFYEKLGFRTVGTSPSGSIKGRYLDLMELRLETS